MPAATGNSAYLAIDQGTTSSRAILFNQQFEILYTAQREFPQYYPKNGWVEQDPEELWQSVLNVAREALTVASDLKLSVKHVGITNQRETTLVWNKESGQPVYNAIVWQDRRTSGYCSSLSVHENLVQQKTGLKLDPYFSASKIRWILDNVEGAAELAANNKLLFGTVDTFLTWRLTNGKVHATDVTNASRTSLFNIHSQQWDKELLALFDIPAALLPEVKDCADDFGRTQAGLLPVVLNISGVAGDQQAAMVGQGCVTQGSVKATYGTGCFALINTGEMAVTSSNKLLTTIAFQLDNKPCYALEGSIFVAGAAVQWLRDNLKFIKTADQSEKLALQADPNQDVYLVPAFVGLGAPYWDPDCRGALYGLTRNTGAAEITKAALESVCYQTSDLLVAIEKDWQSNKTNIIRVDGGMAASDWTMQMLSDLLNMPVDRPTNLETTALGAAYLAGMQVGFYPSPQDFAKSWNSDKRFISEMSDDVRQKKLAGWKDAVKRTLSSN